MKEPELSAEERKEKNGKCINAEFSCGRYYFERRQNL